MPVRESGVAGGEIGGREEVDEAEAAGVESGVEDIEEKKVSPKVGARKGVGIPF